MKTFTLYILLVALFGFATLGCAKIIDWSPCRNVNSTADCTIHALEIQPCIESASGEICRIQKNHPASIIVDFTPNFSGGNLHTSAVWPHHGANIVLTGMTTNACDWTTCPATAGTRQIYNYTNLIQDMVPVYSYNVEWKLVNAEDKECCVNFDVRVIL